MINFREYVSTDERSWVHCRILAFLDTPYFDDVIRNKPRYNAPSCEFVAESDGEIVGFLDLEFEQDAGSLCTGQGPKGAMMWELGVHPDYRRRGIASTLLSRTIDEARRRDIGRIQAWTREDDHTCRWYEARRFRMVDSYWHVWFYGSKLRRLISAPYSNLTLVKAYAEYTGVEMDKLRNDAHRVLECRCYELRI